MIMEREAKRQHAEPFKVILVGQGSMGGIFSSIVAEDGVPLSIVSVVKSTEQLRLALEKFTDAGVVVCSPKQFHYEQVALSLSHKRDVLCEKPLALSSVEARAAFQQALDVDRRLMVGFQRRVDRSFVEGFRRGLSEVGQLQLVRVISRDPPSSSARDLLSIIWDSLVHDADLCCWAAQGSPVVSANALVSMCDGGKGTRAAATLLFQSGLLAQCIYDQGIDYGYEQRIELHGTRGTVMVGNPAADVHHASVSLHTSARTVVSEGNVASFYATRYREAYRTELLMLSRRESANVNWDHTESHRLCEMMIQSVTQNHLMSAPLRCEVIATRGQKQQTMIHSGGGDRVQLCLVGAGRMGCIRAQLIANNTRCALKCIVDIREKVAKEAAHKYGCAYETDFRKALDDPSLHGVWIASGTQEHVEIIRYATQKGLRVCCEKPISLVSSEIDECYAADRFLYCAFQRAVDAEFAGALEKYRELASAGPVSIASINGDHPCPPPEILSSLGSIFHDLMVHDIFYATKVLDGKLPVAVWATGTSFDPELVKLNVFDTAALIVAYEDGSISAHTARRASVMGYDQRCEIISSQGCLISVENPTSNRNIVFSGQPGRRFESPISYTFEDRYRAAYAEEVNRFVDLITSGRELPVSYRDSKIVSLICDAALESATSKRMLKKQN